MQAPFTLEGKTALVTGSGRGIGRAVAQKLAACGASVMLTDIDEAPLREAAADTGGRGHWLVGDLTAPDFPQKLVDATIAAFGSLDIIVNNAGYVWDNVIQKMTDEQFQAMLNIHLVAPFRILRAASSFLRDAAKREAAEGRRVMRKVVNITSISGVDGIAGQAGYGAGKSGINGLTKVLAKEWGRYNVNVNSVGFGLIDTRLIQPIDKNCAAHNRDGWTADSGGRAACVSRSGQGRLPAGPARDYRGSSRRCPVLLFAAIGLRIRRDSDCQRRGSRLTKRLPGIKKRSGKSADLLIPIRGDVAMANFSSFAGVCIVSGPRVRSAP